MWGALFKLTTIDGILIKDTANVFQQNTCTSANSIAKGLLLKSNLCILRTNILYVPFTR